MAITVPTVDDFSDTTVMRVVRKVVNYLIQTLVPGVNSEVTNATITGVTITQGSTADSIKITVAKPSGNVVSNEFDISQEDVSIVQTASGITIAGTSLQQANATNTGLMTSTSFNNLTNIIAYVGTDDELIPS